MSNPRGPEWSDPTQAGYEYPPNTDPAYSGQYPGQYWGPTAYGPGYSGPMTQPTEQLSPVWQAGPGYPPAPPPPPQPPQSPRWLWIAATAAVLLVAGLVLALVIVSSNSRESTVVAPPQTTSSTASRLPTAPIPTTPIPTTLVPTTPSPLPSTTTRAPLPLPPSLQPTETFEPSETAGPQEIPAPVPAGAETVVYSVSGEGRAINITYVDTGGIMQTEFNVALPWSKEVSLAAPAKNSASVAVVNVGRDVTCSVTVNGAQVRQRTGRGLTICTGVA